MSSNKMKMLLFGLITSCVVTQQSNAETVLPPVQQPHFHPEAVEEWHQSLKGQVVLEHLLEGKQESVVHLDLQHQRLMDRVTRESKSSSDHKPYGTMLALHQYGAGGQDVLLVSQPQKEPVSSLGGRCPSSAPVKHYVVSAINVDITLNQWLDSYPGYMYVLTENVGKVRDEEMANKAGRQNERDKYDTGAVRNGLQQQWIQPLVIRANQGDCLKITLSNSLEGSENVSLQIHGSAMVISGTGKPALSTNPDAIVSKGNSVDMEWYIHPDTFEGTHQFHSYSNDRELTVMGLFGAFVVEPRGSVYLDPLAPQEVGSLQSGWQTIIKNGTGPDFREFVLIYHEVGDQGFRPVNKHGDFLPGRDPLTDVYGPGRMALNYRSEPFGVNNMRLQHEYFGFEDESLGYSSYTFGDPATPIPRSYLGDPAKFRVVHGGSEVFHSHHPHGGAIRWPRNPHAVSDLRLWHLAKNEPVKYPPIRTASDRVDAQVIGPSEAVDLETECGSGLCQQLPGDFLYHCHVAHHYIAGMWGLWRVYNTLQVGEGKNDIMPDLRELPDRAGRVKAGVSSEKLIGSTVDWFGKSFRITASGNSNWKVEPALVTVKDWIEMQLPTSGKPGHVEDERAQSRAYDATVLDWIWQATRAMTERESTVPNPKYKSARPHERLPILFEPSTGKIAWPHLRPHFGKRPPFAPQHNPAPWLEMLHQDNQGQQTSEPAQRGENGRWSLCPAGVARKNYNIHFIRVPITLSKAYGMQPPLIDDKGLLFVLHEEKAKILANEDLRYPLVFRANVYDCIDYTLTSEWEDDDLNNFQSSKVSIHPHLLQFDTQGSDGAITGFSYEQSVRPFTMLAKTKKKGLPAPMNAVLTSPSGRGTKTLVVSNASQYHVNTELMVGADNVGHDEVVRIKRIQGHTITLWTSLRHRHPIGEIVTVEFVRSRLWADADVGTVFWHDHAFPLTTWSHGGFGTLIIEPIGSTYHDPKTGEPIRSGPIADIRTVEPVGYGTSGSFRELMVQVHDTVPATANLVVEGNPPGQPVKIALKAGETVSFRMPESIAVTPMPFLNGGTHTTGSGLNFRGEPIAKRLANNPDASNIFSSRIHGDPSTPLLRAYLGDTVVFRLLHTAMNETTTWTLSGHTFLTERYAGNASRKNSIHVGIAERYDLVVPQAGGPQQMPGDYLYFNGRSSHFSGGAWGILRVLDNEVSDLKKLPSGNSSRDAIPTPPKSVCPDEAPVKSFNVVAMDHVLNFNPKAPDAMEVDFERKILVKNTEGKIYALEDDVQRMTGGLQPSPLTLHVNVGDCVRINLTNRMPNSRASFTAFSLAFDPRDSLGANVGNNPGDQTAGPGESRTYTYYAHPFNGEITSLVWDFGNVMVNPRNGLFGAVVVGPKGSMYRDPKTGQDISLKNSWIADVIVDRAIPGNETRASYRDAALFFQEEDNIFGTGFMPYTQNSAGLFGVNYRSEPHYHREAEGCTLNRMYLPCSIRSPGDPVTPIIEVHAGDQVHIHVLGASNQQNGVFGVEGHDWPAEPWLSGASRHSTAQFSGSETVDIHIRSAGGVAQLPGDYTWMNQRLAYSRSGQWGYFKVLPEGDSRILPLSR